MRKSIKHLYYGGGFTEEQIKLSIHMKTPEQFLREVIKYFPDDYVIDTPDEGISIHSIIEAMEKYAVQSVECAKDSIERLKEMDLDERDYSIKDLIKINETLNLEIKNLTLMLNSAEMRVKDLKSQLRAAHEDQKNDGKSGNTKEWSV